LASGAYHGYYAFLLLEITKIFRVIKPSFGLAEVPNVLSLHMRKGLLQIIGVVIAIIIILLFYQA